MDWARDLPGWPLSHLSRAIRHKPHRWHVQETGSGRTVLLLHGAGASTHSWRDLVPLLCPAHHVVALDLPGQGFSRPGTKTRCGLDPMTADIAALCASQGWRPDLLIGHSAGAAIALNLARRLRPAPAVVGINAALGRFDGMAGWLFPLLARVLALNPLTAPLFAAGGPSLPRARRLIESTGSRLDDAAIGLYARLIADRDHVDGTLQMMAQWNPDALLARLGDIATPCLLLTGARDTAVAPSVSARAQAALPQADLVGLPDLGHLAHEEAPAETARTIQGWYAALDR